MRPSTRIGLIAAFLFTGWVTAGWGAEETGETGETGALTTVPAAKDVVPRQPLVSSLPARSEYKVLHYHEFGADWEKSTKWRAAARQVSHGIEVESVSADAGTATVRIETKWSDGKTYTRWVFRGLQVSRRSDGKGYAVEGGTTVSGAGFPELQWVNSKNFKGVGKFGGQLVFVFRESLGVAASPESQGNGTEPAEEGGDAAPDVAPVAYRSGSRVAYLDVKTQFPVLSNDGQVIRVYKISPPPRDRLVPPRDMVEMLQKRHDVLQDRVALPGDPAG